MAATITPTDRNARHPPSGGGRPGHTAAQRTRGPGFSLVGTNKKDSSLLWSSGVRGARPEAPRAPAPARAQTGLLCSELLGSACGRWAIKNTGDMAIGVRALISHYSVTETFEFTWITMYLSILEYCEQEKLHLPWCHGLCLANAFIIALFLVLRVVSGPFAVRALCVARHAAFPLYAITMTATKRENSVRTDTCRSNKRQQSMLYLNSRNLSIP